MSYINIEKVFLSFPIFSTNKGSTDKYIRTIILYIRILCLCMKGSSNKLSRSSTSLDLTQYPLIFLFVCRILAGYSGCMVSHLCEETAIQLPQGVTFSIHRLQNQGYTKFSYYGIRFSRLNLICYPLLFSILCPAWYIEIISNPSKRQRALRDKIQKKMRKKKVIVLWSKFLNREKIEDS